MELFPTQYSTLSAAALGSRIAADYGLAGMHCRYLLRGVSDTYVLEGAAGKYIFKVYRNNHRSLEEIKGEVELLNILRQRGAQVAYPLEDLQGEQIQAFQAAEGVRYGVLYSYARGAVVVGLQDEHFRIVGREMAFNHNITSGITLQHARKQYDIDSLLIEPLMVIKAPFERYNYQERYDYLVATSEKILTKMQSFNTAAFSDGYCHYDYLPKNFHFDEHNNMTLFDFDFAGKGWLANDIASFFIYFILHGMKKEEAYRAFGIFIEGYREVRPLSDEEVAAVPYLGFMFWIFFLGFQYEHFDDFTNVYFGPRYLRERVGVIKEYVEMYCEV